MSSHNLAIMSDEAGEPPSGQAPPNRPVRIAVAGCSHGEMDAIYGRLAELERQRGYKADVLICCGDFQAVRNYGDLWTMACPEKYLQLNTFHRYYSGEVLAPVLTIFIGGNHEASGYMQELPYGGWAAPNMYYMGWAGSVLLGGLRIAGMSGIGKAKARHKGHFECPPFDNDAKRTVYYTREADVFKLRQLRSVPVDVVFTHDWPCGITEYGDKERLFRFKRHLKEDADRGELGSEPYMRVLRELKPRRWFSAHLHCRFDASVPHEDGSVTQFLALDKPLPRRQFLDMVEMDTSERLSEGEPLQLQYDPVWLAVVRGTDHLTSVRPAQHYMPSPAAKDRWDFAPTDDELSAVRERLAAAADVVHCVDGRYYVANAFERTAPAHRHGDTLRNCGGQTAYYRNAQTARLAQMLGVQDPNALLYAANERRQPKAKQQHQPQQQQQEPAPVQQSANVVLESATAHFDRSLFDRADFGDSDFVLDRGPPAAAMEFDAPKLLKRSSHEPEPAQDEPAEEKADGASVAVPPKVAALAKMKRRNRDSLPADDD